MYRSAPRAAAVYGVDLGKNLFHVVGLDERGAVVQRVKFRRDTVLAFFARASPSLVGIEACPGSQWLVRKLQALGHSVRIAPAQFVKPFVESQKNDTIDAEAITEAVTRPTMRFTQVRTTKQIDLQALHRIRDQLARSRTRLITQARAFCLEYGMAIRQGTGVFRSDLQGRCLDVRCHARCRDHARRQGLWCRLVPLGPQEPRHRPLHPLEVQPADAAWL